MHRDHCIYHFGENGSAREFPLGCGPADAVEEHRRMYHTPEALTKREHREEREVITSWRSISAASVFYFLSSVTMHAMGANAYPYLKKLDDSRPEAWFGLCFGASKVGQAITLILGSLLTNRTNKYRVTFIVGRVLCIAGLIAYAAAGVFAPDNRKYLILIGFFFVGASEGTLVLIRGYGPRFSSIADRARALTFITAGGLGGILFGPLVNLIFSFGGKGDFFHFLINWNLYTLPCLVLIVFNLGALVFVFMMEEPEVERTSRKRSHASFLRRIYRWFRTLFDDIDSPLLFVLLVVKMTSVGGFYAVLTTLMQHLSAVAGLDAPTRVLVFSGGQIGAGFLSAIFAALYTVFLRTKRLFHPTYTFLYAMILFSGFALITLPWPFASPVVLYDNETAPHGCNSDTFEWCKTTHLIDLRIWFGFGCFFMGVAMPLSLIAQDILYSRVLEHSTRADLFQGFYGMVDCITLTFVPWKVGGLYKSLGPAVLYSIVAIVLIATCCFFALFIPRFKRALDPKDNDREIEWRYNNVPIAEATL